jgi:hypothetical protein
MLRVEWVNQDKLLRESFKRLKSDIDALRSQLASLHEEVASLQQTSEDILKNPPESQTISESQPSLSPETLRLLIKEAVKEELSEALKQQNTKAAAPVSENSQPETESETTTPIEAPQPKMKDRLKEDLMKNYERNKRSIIKQQILSEASKGNFTKIGLRDVVVSQKSYCSKASFYRYMDELELEGLITYQRRKGKDLIQVKLQEPIAL